MAGSSLPGGGAGVAELVGQRFLEALEVEAEPLRDAASGSTRAPSSNRVFPISPNMPLTASDGTGSIVGRLSTRPRIVVKVALGTGWGAWR